MNTCPCCGQQVDNNDLLISLETNTVSRDGVVLHLHPQQAEVLWALQRASPRTVTYEQLESAMYGPRGSRSDNVNLILKVAISVMRKKLKPLRIGIENRYGEGYALNVAP